MKKILLIQQKMIGDVLASTVICEVLKKQFPLATIHYMIHSNTKPVVQGNPFVDTILEFTPEHKKSKKAFRKLIKQVKSEQFDWVIDAYAKTESNLISRFSRAQKRTSYHKWYSSFYYTDTVQRRPVVYTQAGNAIEDRLRLVLSEEEVKKSEVRPRIFLSEKEKMNAKKFLNDHNISLNKPLIMLGILGSATNKSLPLPYMAQVIDAIAEKTNGDLLFNYIPSQEKEAKELYLLTKKTTQNQIHFNVYGKGLREFIALVSHCDMLIGNEGGAVNMAKALMIPTFTIFSPWVAKAAWNMFEDGIDNVSVHLEDFEPEIYSNHKPKEFKKQAFELYKKLTPERILPKLKKYLANKS